MLMGLRGTQTDHDGPPLTPLTPPIDLFAPLSLCLYVSLRLCQRRRRSVSCTITLSPLKPPSSLWGSESGSDDPIINPSKDPKLGKLASERLLLCVAKKDLVRDRGLYCKELLEKNGWSGVAEVVETKDEDHVFHLFKPNCENAQATSFSDRYGLTIGLPAATIVLLKKQLLNRFSHGIEIYEKIVDQLWHVRLISNFLAAC
ncbi:putative carboxylesterase 2 [Glycine max]|nr:putative carboxylesterase 2 [Glycine max]